MKIINISGNYHYSQLWENIQNTYNLIYPGESRFVVFTKVKAGDKSSESVYDFPVLNFSDRLLYFKKINKCYHALANNSVLLEKCDCIHAHTLFSDGGVAYKIWQKHGIPYVLSVRNTDLNSFYKYKPYLSFFADKVLKHSHSIVCLSPAYRDRLLDKVHNAELRREIASKIVIIPNGIDDYWFENIGNPHKRDQSDLKLRVVTAGQISRNKNQISVAKALASFEEKGYQIEYFLCGSIIDEEYFKQLSKFDFVRYLGKKTKEELRNLYLGCDIFILASKSETFGLVYAEALTQGLPILYSKGEGFDNQFPDGQVGFSIRSDDVNDILNGIQHVIDNYADLSKRAIESSVKFRISDVINGFYGLLSDSTTIFRV